MSRSVRLNGHLDLGKAYYKIYFATLLYSNKCCLKRYTDCSPAESHSSGAENDKNLGPNLENDKNPGPNLDNDKNPGQEFADEKLKAWI
jgi:hypothetical protein